jgi:tRNA/tmRNA/rRNA uracil-C5-methylase (TrmA/RlmC/RlmD family)
VPATGDVIPLAIEKAAAGGRMIARHDGQVVLVAGAIPGERVAARIDREHRGVLYAATVDVLEAHPARRPVSCDPACGGMTYAHIDPDTQRRLKADVIADAFARIGKLPLAAPVPVAASPEHGYRMRARLHVRGGRLGSFREGTHEICDYMATRQLSDASAGVLARIAACLAGCGVGELEALEIAENLSGDDRVLHLQGGRADTLDGTLLAALASIPGTTGLSTSTGPQGRVTAAAGRPWVADRLDAFEPGLDERCGGLMLRRHARSFFQANRFLAPALARTVLAHVRPGLLVDLYAGVGLFAVCAAAAGQSAVVAVEGDRTSAADLKHNAAPFRGRVTVHEGAVEETLARLPGLASATLVVDPPRTGMTREAVGGILDSGAPRIVYVSCDVATLARDAARLVAAGYHLASLEAFDLFPNTPHVESLAVFERG